MMLALMYGWMDSAKIVAVENAPPDIISIMPNTVFRMAVK